ncbi:MAG: ATP-binding protein [Candidatus Pacebacteria bacterium]|nr:ATP-binding protein [Candidatus Paceibacterota bacterium]
MELNFIFNLSLIANIVSSGVVALFILFTTYKEDPAARKFTQIAFANAAWTLFYLLGQLLPNPQDALLVFKWGIFFLIILAFAFLAFTIRSIEKFTKKSYKVWFRIGQAIKFFFLALITLDIVFGTELLVKNITHIKTWGVLWPDAGRFFIPYLVYFMGCFTIGFLLILFAATHIEEKERNKIKYLNWAAILAGIGGSTLYLMWYDIPFPPVGGWVIPVYILGLFYSITKFKLFNMRVITTELFTLTIWMLMFGQILLSTNIELFILDSVIFLVTIFFGLLTIQNSIATEKQREELEKATRKLDKTNHKLSDLNQNLQQKVDEQTKEVRKAYEIEKEARIELEKLDRAKNSFLLTTQHHLRTPLTVVKGFLDLSTHEENNVQIRSYMIKATKAINSMAELVNEFLNVSQLEVGETMLNPQPTNIANIVSEIQGELKLAIKEKDLSFALDFSEEAQHTKAIIDSKMIKAALYNLIDNAVKYTPHGKITIIGEIYTHPIEKTEMLRLKIKDTGIGIRKEDLKNAFQHSFERGVEAEKANKTGKGIGLILSKNIIQAHRGNIFVNSEGVGKGTTLTVEIPIGVKRLWR